MTEEEWFAWRDPREVVQRLLADIRAPIAAAFTHRKMVLFGAACCRRVEDRWKDERVCTAVEAAERHCDARTNEDRQLIKPVRLLIREDREWASSEPGRLAKAVCGRSGWSVALECSWEASFLFGGATLWTEHERGTQMSLLRDIIGNPFRSTRGSPKWRTETAVLLAAQMYESRDFSAMPILADALQDAGCDSDDIFSHCRDANQVHVRGCWVVDLVLGKS